MENEFTRPALGENASIGSLYNARTDSFVNVSILSRMPTQGVLYHPINTSGVLHSYGDSYVENFKAMSVENGIAASLLSGLATPNPLVHHLIGGRGPTQDKLQAFFHHMVIADRHELDLMNQEVQQCITASHLRTSTATHFVTEVVWGAQSTLKATTWVDPSNNKEAQETTFRQQVESLAIAMRKTIDGSITQPLPSFDQMTVRSTTLGSREIVLCDIEECFKFLGLIPAQIKSEGGKPVAYKLQPVPILGVMRLVQIEPDLPLGSASQECLQRFLQLCDEFQRAEPPLLDYLIYATKYSFCLPDGHSDNITSRIERLRAGEQELKDSFARALQAVRCGSSNSEALWQVLKEFEQGSRSLGAITSFPQDFRWKTSLVDSLVSRGVTYFKYDDRDLERELANRKGAESYVMFVGDEARRDQESWNANQALMQSLLQSRKPHRFFAIVDCDAADMPLTKCYISQYEGARQVVTDLFEEQEYMAGMCFARYFPDKLDTTRIQRPTKRCLVKIPCPGGDCSAGEICEWHCIKCHAPLEYGYADQYIYCDCGRTLYCHYDFKCNRATHGSGYDKFNDTNLLNFLKSLDQSDYLNILILGETGVGKSTFINAFVNYLYFQTLDEALDTEELHSVIPCHFTIQSRQQVGDDVEIKETKVKVGERADEKDGSGGDSATQQTQVYPITVGATTYRLIDTPGIGDTRGLAHDKANMVDILRTVSGYDHLHGILILVRSNNARLTAHFSFCVKELLSHLHRDATHNVVWGFTNTRISNYTPGDTYGSLKTLLNERSDIGLSLSHSSMYCFDSESFRFLAAYKQGTVMENKPDFVSSWEKSSKEAERMLRHFRLKDPHPVKSTLSLNGTRALITQLTKPMAEISKQINANIATMDDEVRQLADDRLTGDKLRAKLRPEVTLLRLKATTEPRTVCKGQGCMEQKDDGTGTDNKITEYPNLPYTPTDFFFQACHMPCYLQNIRPDVLALPDIANCAAFSGNQECLQCHHSWTLHMHIYYEIETYKGRITDTTIEQKMKEHANDVTLKEAAIKDRKRLMVEWRAEHEKVRDAAAKFGLWMKANSILPINDATLAYLEILINAEQAKVDAGGIGNKKVLADLEEDKRKHEELVKVLEESMKGTGQTTPIKQDEVEQIVNALYGLKHFGKSLEELQIGITQAHEMTNREMPHRVNHRHKPRAGHSRTPSSQRSANGSHHGHGQSQSWGLPIQTNHLHPSQAALMPAKLQRPQKKNPGFASGTMRPNSGTPSMPGSFVVEVPSRERPSPSSQGATGTNSQKSKGFMASLNPWNR